MPGPALRAQVVLSGEVRQASDLEVMMVPENRQELGWGWSDGTARREEGRGLTSLEAPGQVEMCMGVWVLACSADQEG